VTAKLFFGVVISFEPPDPIGFPFVHTTIVLHFIAVVNSFIGKIWADADYFKSNICAYLATLLGGH
jgi:hypothetical protein